MLTIFWLFPAILLWKTCHPWLLASPKRPLMATDREFLHRRRTRVSPTELVYSHLSGWGQKRYIYIFFNSEALSLLNGYKIVHKILIFHLSWENINKFSSHSGTSIYIKNSMVPGVAKKKRLCHQANAAICNNFFQIYNKNCIRINWL